MEIHGFPAMGCDGKLAGNHLTFPMKYEATRLPAFFFKAIRLEMGVVIS